MDTGRVSCARSFLLDNLGCFYYSGNSMLNGIKIFSSDNVWRQILSEFGAEVLYAPDVVGVDFDALEIPQPATAMEIKTAIQNAIDGNIHELHKILGRTVQLPVTQAQIVLLLKKTGGMPASDLRTAMGYSPNATTHTVDTAIYQLRKRFGRNFIINDGGVYKLGGL